MGLKAFKHVCNIHQLSNISSQVEDGYLTRLFSTLNTGDMYISHTVLEYDCL